MKTRVMTSMLVIVLMAVSAQAMIYTEDFNGADPGTWIGMGSGWQSSGGVGDSGYMEAFRAVNYYDAIRPKVGEIGYRDYVADFGTQFRITYDIKFLSGQNGGMSFNISGGLTDNASSYSYWRKDIYTVAGGGAPTEWTTVSFDVDTTWTKAQAAAQGWEETKTGSSTWQEMWEDAAGIRDYSTNFFSQASDRVKGPNNYTGIDNVRIETIPEPATIGLLALGFGFLRRRR